MLLHILLELGFAFIVIVVCCAWERLTRLKLLQCAFTSTQTFEVDVLQLFLQSLFIILSFFLESSSLKMSQAFHHLSMHVLLVT